MLFSSDLVASLTPENRRLRAFKRWNYNRAKPKLSLYPSKAATWLLSILTGNGTGGTVSGVGEALKMRDPSIKIVAVEPSDSPVLSGGNLVLIRFRESVQDLFLKRTKLLS